MKIVLKFMPNLREKRITDFDLFFLFDIIYNIIYTPFFKFTSLISPFSVNSFKAHTVFIPLTLFNFTMIFIFCKIF